jgi:hypothetical protein
MENLISAVEGFAEVSPELRTDLLSVICQESNFISSWFSFLNESVTFENIRSHYSKRLVFY